MMREIPERCCFRPGDSIGGCYQVKESLGEGSFGMVYRVQDRHGDQYALKVLPLWKREAKLRDELVNRFQLEFETGRIKSDYIVYSYDTDWVKGNPYIVMELCTNVSLQKFMEHPDTDYEKVACDILYGLRALHRNGKVHRDLKPANILRKASGTFALSDFGTSGNSRTQPVRKGFFSKVQTFGTLAYMSPEQINPKKAISVVLPTTDIFSFGVVLYEMLFHQYPFGDLEEEGDVAIYTKNVKAGNWNDSVFRENRQWDFWRRIIAGCLQPDFKKRFQSVDEVLSLIPSVKRNAALSENSPTIRPSLRTYMLRVVYGAESGREIRLDDFVKSGQYIITVGRVHNGYENAISLQDTDACYLSRRHCTLEYDAFCKSWRLRDGQWYDGQWHNSLNGTFVNATELHDPDSGVLLKDGDIISVGEVKLRMECL